MLGFSPEEDGDELRKLLAQRPGIWAWFQKGEHRHEKVAKTYRTSDKDKKAALPPVDPQELTTVDVLRLVWVGGWKKGSRRASRKKGGVKKSIPVINSVRKVIYKLIEK